MEHGVGLPLATSRGLVISPASCGTRESRPATRLSLKTGCGTSCFRPQRTWRSWSLPWSCERAGPRLCSSSQPSAVFLLFIGIHNAWDAVTYIALKRKRDPSDP